MHFVWFRSTSLRVFKFVQIKVGGSNFWWEPILQNVWIIWSPLLYFNFKSFLDPNSSSFNRFQCILYDSGILRSGFSNLYKLKRRDLISGGSQFCRVSELFGPHFCISILKSSMDPNYSSFIRFQSILLESERLFLKSWNFYKLKRGDLISRGICRMSDYLVASSVFQF